jgi:polar amino acid transport system substrate-binding protein
MTNNKYLLISLLIFLSASLRAEEFKTVKVVGADFPPYYTTSRSDYGVIGKKLSELLSKHHIKPEYHFKPFARALEEAKTGKADIIAALYKTKEREQLFIYSKPFISSDVKLFTIHHPNHLYTSPESLSGFTLGKIRKSSTNLDLEAFPKLNLIYINSYQQGIALLRHKRIDFLIANKLVLDQLLTHESSQDKIIELEPPLSNEQTYIAISRNSPKKELLLNIIK